MLSDVCFFFFFIFFFFFFFFFVFLFWLYASLRFQYTIANYHSLCFNRNLFIYSGRGIYLVQNCEEIENFTKMVWWI